MSTSNKLGRSRAAWGISPPHRLSCRVCDGGHDFAGEQCQCVRIIEVERLQHDPLHADARSRSDLFDNFFWLSHQPVASSRFSEDRLWRPIAPLREPGREPACPFEQFRLIAPDDVRHHPGTDDRVGIATLFTTVFPQEPDLPSVIVEIDVGYIPLVRKTRCQSKRPLLTPTTDHDRHAIPSLWSRTKLSTLQAEILSLVRNLLAGPEKLNHFQRFGQAIHALADRQEGEAKRLMFTLVPSCSDTENVSPARRMIERNRMLSEFDRMAKAHW